MRFLAASLIPTGALIAFCISYIIVFRHERRHTRLSAQIASRLPQPLEFTYECNSLEELRELDSELFLSRFAGDFYFGHSVRRYESELNACRDAYMKLVLAESGLDVSKSTVDKADRKVIDAIDRLRFVYIRWEYKNPWQRFGKVYSGGCTIKLDRCVEVTRHAEPAAYHMYDRDMTLSVIKRMSKRYNDYPGAWCILRCPEGTAAKNAPSESQGYVSGSSNRVWRDLKRYLRKHGGWLHLENALMWGTWVRIEPSPYNYEPYEVETGLCRSAGWM